MLRDWLIDPRPSYAFRAEILSAIDKAGGQSFSAGLRGRPARRAGLPVVSENIDLLALRCAGLPTCGDVSGEPGGELAEQ